MRSLILSIIAGFCIQVSASESAELRELTFAPSFGYSNFSGFVYGGKLALSLPLSHSFQWETGGMVLNKGSGSGSEKTASGIFTGPVFNFFGADLSHSFFIGGGIGFSNMYPFGVNERPEQKLPYGYFKGGKRFVLNDAGTFLYKPEFSLSYSNQNQIGAFSIDFLQFSWSF